MNYTEQFLTDLEQCILDCFIKLGALKIYVNYSFKIIQMKKKIIQYFINVFVTCFFSMIAYGQAPESFKYQAVVRNANGDIVSDQNVNFLIQIQQERIGGSVVYEEQHTIQTNEYGLVSLAIGEGTDREGRMDGIEWGSDEFFLNVFIDINGGTAFTNIGSTQILSVPYALHAKTVEENDDADADPENEIQSLTLTDSTLSLSLSNSVNLPLKTKGDTTIYTDTMSVGIGTSDPKATLDVNGDANIEGDITIGGTKLRPGKYRLYRGGSTDIHFTAPNDSTYILDITDGTQDYENEYMFYDYINGTTDAILYLRMDGSTSMHCVLLHIEDDSPSSSRGIYYAADVNQPDPTPSGLWGPDKHRVFKISRENITQRVLATYASYIIMCF